MSQNLCRVIFKIFYNSNIFLQSLNTPNSSHFSQILIGYIINLYIRFYWEWKLCINHTRFQNEATAGDQSSGSCRRLEIYSDLEYNIGGAVRSKSLVFSVWQCQWILAHTTLIFEQIEFSRDKWSENYIVYITMETKQIQNKWK